MISFLKKIVNKTKRIKSDKRGVVAIELGIGILIAIGVFAALLDYLIIANRMQAMSTTMTYISKIVANQGCVASSASYCGTTYNANYIKNGKFVTSKELYTNIKKIMDNERIDETQWEVRIGKSSSNMKTLAPTSTNIGLLGDYGDRIYIEIIIQYRWQVLSNYLPGNIPMRNMNSKQSIISLYKIRSQDANTSGFQYGN